MVSYLKEISAIYYVKYLCSLYCIEANAVTNVQWDRVNEQLESLKLDKCVLSDVWVQKDPLFVWKLKLPPPYVAMCKTTKTTLLGTY